MPKTSKLPALLTSLGMTPKENIAMQSSSEHALPVLLDGCVVGEVWSSKSKRLADCLRMYKVCGNKLDTVSAD